MKAGAKSHLQAAANMLQLSAMSPKRLFQLSRQFWVSVIIISHTRSLQ